MQRLTLLAVVALLSAVAVPGCLGLLPGSEAEQKAEDTASDFIDADNDGIEDAFDPDGGTGEIPSNVTPPDGVDDGVDGEPVDEVPVSPPNAPIPVASFIVTRPDDATKEVNRGFKNEYLVLNASGSTDPAGRPLQYAWLVFEGDKATRNFSGKVVEKVTFEEPGVKRIRLTVTNDKGGIAVLEKPYYRDIQVEEKGSKNWGSPPLAVQAETYTVTKNITIPKDGRNGLLSVVWTNAQAARIMITSPSGNPLVDQTAEGGNMTVPIQDAASFAEAGVYKLQLTLTYDPAADGTPVALEPAGDELGATYEVDLAVFIGEAKPNPAA
ncbi:MAG TPA: PKD domain-containing protein [Candidatus Thermoplasmatota archaeon]|nr:PKD domain-containing protein [Candidatus Thermoplasmatota archaeon]